MTLDVVFIKRALLSVSDKTGLIPLAKALADRGVELLSTGGTAKAMRDAGLSVVDVSTFTGFPEMLDGRVKTLHPRVHGGLLGRRDDSKHQEEMTKHNIVPIDLVVVNLYPFEKIAGRVDAHWDELIENIDIGGPSMLRSAAKNHDAVTVLCDASDYDTFLAQFSVTGGTNHMLRRQLALKVFARTAAYDGAIASRLAQKHEIDVVNANGGDTHHAVEAGLSEVINIQGKRTQTLRYGENPHQHAAVYSHRHPGERDLIDLASTMPLQGKELSYNNLLDADAAVFALKSLIDESAANTHGAVIIKHNTPCGAARADTIHAAYQNALKGDPTSAFGGIVCLSHEVDFDLATLLSETFLEVIIAPSFSQAAREVFAKKSQLRLLALDNLVKGHIDHLAVRAISGGFLLQENDRASFNVKDAKVVTKRAPTPDEYRDLDVAFRLCAAVKSNAITFAKDNMLLSAGGGQTSRVDSAKIAVAKAVEHKHNTAGAACGSDAFFPFADGLEVIIAAGITAVAQPGGSKRDEEVIAAANAANIAMVFTGKRHFRH